MEYNRDNRYDANPDYNLVNESGTCPVCGEEDLEYEGAFEIVDQGGYYRASCPHCEWAGKEWYNINFSEYTDDDNQDMIDAQVDNQLGHGSKNK